MRTFYFKARNIGQEKYLTYTMGEETELDEDVLDYCEDNDVKELIDIIYEEDDDYDYLTYDVTGKKTLNELIKEEVTNEQALFLVRNIAGNLISIKEQAIHLSYILLNREYVYVGDNNEVSFICVPIENKGSLSVEFKGFLRQLLANMKYDVEEDLNFVGKLLTYINSDNFNLRGLVGLAEALMEEAGIEYDEAGTIETEGVEVVSAEPEEEEKPDNKMAEFMQDDNDVPLPEIGDDEPEEEEEPEEVEEELESILPAGMEIPEQIPEIAVGDDLLKASLNSEPEPEIAPEPIPEVKIEPESEPESEPEAEAVSESAPEPFEQPEPQAPIKQEVEPIAKPQPVKKKEEDLDVIKNKIKELVGDVPPAKQANDDPKAVKTLADLEEMIEANKAPAPKKNVVKVNRAAIIQSIAEHEAETEELSEEELNKSGSEEVSVKEEKTVEEEKSAETVKANTLLNAPKAMPYLIRVNTEERIMLNKATFKIGKASRGVDYSVSGNGAISRQHAVITQKDGVCYIKDNKSTNHTYVNDKEVEEGKEEILTHDSIIKLGDEEFLFKIR